MTSTRSIDAYLSKKPITFNGIQALRCFAAVMVVMVHASQSWGFGTQPEHPASYWTSEASRVWINGASGVDIFFVISGFVMAISTLTRTKSKHTARSFMERRILRVVPLYWMVTALFLAESLAKYLYPGLGAVRPATLGLPYLLASFFFIPAHNSVGVVGPLLAVGWTLNFEMFFYVLFAIGLWFKTNVSQFLVPIMVGLSAIGLFRHDSWPAFTVLASTMLLEFLAGLLLARYVTRGGTISMVFAIPAGIAGALFLLLKHFEQVPDRLRGFVWGIPALLIVLAAVSVEERYGKLWPRFVLFMGDASYSLYLIHLPVLNAMTRVLRHAHVLQMGRVRVQDEMVTVAVDLALSIAVAVVVHLYVENPMTEYLRKNWLHENRKLVQAVPIPIRPAPIYGVLGLTHSK
jgi:peptidoglycan/LPS O-acetylase OafA/YrhL